MTYSYACVNTPTADWRVLIPVTSILSQTSHQLTVNLGGLTEATADKPQQARPIAHVIASTHLMFC